MRKVNQLDRRCGESHTLRDEGGRFYWRVNAALRTRERDLSRCGYFGESQPC